MLKKTNYFLILIIVFAISMRLMGIDHGFPFIFHPDEPAVVRTALGMRFELNPKHFDWPHLFTYLNFFVYKIFAWVRNLLEQTGFKETISNHFPLVWDDEVVFYLISRVFAAILGACSVLPIYLASKKLFSDDRKALFSALTFALIPMHVWASHYALIDVPMIFFLSWGIYFSIRAYLDKKLTDFLLAGLFIGFAGSTKYNGALGALSIILAFALPYFSDKNRWDLWKKNFYKLAYAGIASVIGFILGTPFALLDFDTFSRTDGPQGALWQFENVGKVGFIEQLLKFPEILFVKMLQDLGYVFLIVFVGYFIYMLIKRKFNYSYFLLYFPALLFIFYISGFEKSRSHYLMISYPYIALACGSALGVLWDFLKEKKYFFIFLFSVPLALNFYQLVQLNNLDTRVVLYRFLLKQQEKSSTWYYDSSSINVVLEELKHKPIKKVDGVGFKSEKAGLYIRILEETEDFRDVVSSKLAPVEVISNHLRMGPDIAVYEVSL